MSHESYQVVLNHLQEYLNGLVNRLTYMDTLIASIEHLAQAEPTPNSITPNYSNMSVRLAILWLLFDSVPRTFKTREITQAIREGGYRTGSRFDSSSVSAVLCSMKARKEVETTEHGDHCITELGKAVWRAKEHLYVTHT